MISDNPNKSQLSATQSFQGFGLHCIQKPRWELSVVFVHGILSGGEVAWGQPSWPELLANDPQFQDAGIFVFSYQTTISSGTYSIGDVVDDLREHFKLNGMWDQRRVVFVCHSMGGIVVRRFIVVNQAKLMERSCAVGLFLVASPSLGSRYANLIGSLGLVLQHTQGLALRFSQTNTWLNDLDREFVTLKESGRLPLFGKELVEDRPIALSRWFGLRRQVVEPFAAAKYFGEPFKVPASDHTSISKPQSPEAIQHRVLKQFVAEFNGFANKVLPNIIEPVPGNLDRLEEIRRVNPAGALLPFPSGSVFVPIAKRSGISCREKDSPLTIETGQRPRGSDKLFNDWFRNYDIFLRNTSEEDVLLVEAICKSSWEVPRGDGMYTGTVLPAVMYDIEYDIGATTSRALSPPFEIKRGSLCCLRFHLRPTGSHDDSEHELINYLCLDLIDSRGRVLPVIDDHSAPPDPGAARLKQGETKESFFRKIKAEHPHFSDDHVRELVRSWFNENEREFWP
ncbi:pimeloyl-ACP methyl ester carboxylesterase [Bradyrhizobium elkanii]|uniref:esterase/lipase family protein n=1 Tax=Bradyrhizobium TaxID=374 RepID=UPI0004B81249|nr:MULTISPECIES: alpha/beta fold hydrolase [Bradyrhizobium]MCS3929178.1 pimeloyl-ACP methyl ester carboxylesterase [Bradyrhizobium elkanii]MCS3969734.1 pimeloyl-ACP methyl ester carboxylesterase [Bradyrhizobium japonicum]